MGASEIYEYGYDVAPKLDMKRTEDINSQVPNTWCETPAEWYDLRSPTYLEDSVKQPSKESAFELVGFQLLKSKNRVYHLAENLASLKEWLAQFPNDFFFITVRRMPTRNNDLALTIAKRRLPHGEDKAFDETFERFLNGDDEYRNLRLKYIAKLSDAPWLALKFVKSIGGERPAILGKGYLKQEHYSGPNYYEVDVDIGSSKIASQITGSVVKYSNNFKIGECFVIEAQNGDLLPERAIYTLKLVNIAIKQVAIPLSQEDEDFFKTNPFPVK